MSSVGPSEFQAAGEKIAAAEAAATKAGAALREAEARRDQVAHRIGALAKERGMIIARRAGGDNQPDDAAKVSLLDADLEGLHRMQADAAATLALANSAAETAKRGVAHARERLEYAEAQRALALLSTHADELGALLHATIAKITVIEARWAQSKTWMPRRELVDAVRKAALAAGGW